MSKTLKEFEDGSEFNTSHILPAAALIITIGAVGALVGVKWEDFKTNRFYKKNPQYLPNNED